MSTSVLQIVNSVDVLCFIFDPCDDEYDLGHVMLSLWYPTLAVQYYFFTENVSILMSFVKEDADVDYIIGSSSNKMHLNIWMECRVV